MTVAIQLITLLILGLAFTICLVLRRLFFHPLANIPGRRFAAISSFYEWYWDCLRPGQYSFDIQKMHNQYGPIVRIGPNEVHIRDSDYFDALYSLKLEKDPWFYGYLNDEGAGFFTTDYHDHQRKRRVVNPFFSKANIGQLEHLLRNILSDLLTTFDKYRWTGQPVSLKYAFKSFAADVISELAFPQSMQLIKGPNFSARFHDSQDNSVKMVPWFRHIPGLSRLAFGAIRYVLPFLPMKRLLEAFTFILYIEEQVKTIAEGGYATKTEHPKRPILSEILHSELPANERTAHSIEQEGQAFIVAGISMVARCLEVAVFHILSSPKVLSKLTAELRGPKTGSDTILSLSQLGKMPFFSATVLEALRMSPAFIARCPRINRTSAIQYQDYNLPTGTVISMSPSDVLSDANIFLEPNSFLPERWLDLERNSKLQRHMVVFGRGSRNCLGQHLAVAEIALVLGNMLKRYDMELYETNEEDIVIAHDYFVPFAKKGSRGVRVMLKDHKKVI